MIHVESDPKNIKFWADQLNPEKLAYVVTFFGGMRINETAAFVLAVTRSFSKALDIAKKYEKQEIEAEKMGVGARTNGEIRVIPVEIDSDRIEPSVWDGGYIGMESLQAVTTGPENSRDRFFANY